MTGRNGGTEREAAVRELPAQATGADPAAIGPGLAGQEMPAWPSPKHLMLVSQLEARFGVAFSASDLPLGRTGSVLGVAFLDRDGNGAVSPDIDALAPGVRIALLVRGTRDTTARTATDNLGVFRFFQVPVGTYWIAVDTTTIGDTVRVAPALDTGAVTVQAGDTARVLVPITYRTYPIELARRLPLGKKFFVEGVALNGWGSFGDSTVHVADRTGAIRATRVPPAAIAAGDSVRILGTATSRDGQPALTECMPFLLGKAELPPAESASTTDAARAAGGRLDARLARVAGAILLERQTTITGELRLVGDDGSGPLEILIEPATGISPAPYVPGAVLAATGVLVPTPGGGRWQLKPRTVADLAVTYPTVTVAEARRSPPGRRVVLTGKALNSWATYGDSTLHVADATGAIRAVRVQPAEIAAGDTIRILGRVSILNGQPALIDATATRLDASDPPAPATTSTATAARADGGRLDAALVRIAGATILGATTTPTGDLALTADDGSGALDLLVERKTGINTAPLEPGALLDATGLLVATPSGRWALKPRTNQDLAVTYPTVTIAEARRLPLGKKVYVHGIALNGWAAFGDSTVHITDRTTAIRTRRTTPAQVFAGDSVRVLGTAAALDGQPVLDLATITVLRIGVGTPPPAELTNALAATADQGRLDAALARVRNVRIENVGVTAEGDLLLNTRDATGTLEILVDRHTGIAFGPFTAGTAIDASGVLVPTLGSTRWRLKARAAGDLVIK